MADNYNNQNNMDTDFEMLNIPENAFRRKKINCSISNDTICYSNTVFFTILIMQFVIVYIVFGVYSNDLNNLLQDAKTNMKDLSVILPEVGNVLQIVQQICKAPEYAPYCHSTLNKSSVDKTF